MEESNFSLPPARDLLKSYNEEDKMLIDENTETDKPLLPSISSQTDEFIRHRLSDLSVSQQQRSQQQDTLKTLSPLEPTTQQPYFESLPYSRRGSVTDPHGYRRPSITELNNLPLPNSTVVSRRGSVATITDYDYSSRSPSPSPFSTTKRYHENDTSAAAHPYAMNTGRRDSLPNNNIVLHSNVYDPFQRRHSIATAEPTYNHRTNTIKYKSFRFPATIQESPNYRAYSAPPSPPQPALTNVGHQEILHEPVDLKKTRLPYNGGGPVLSRRRPSLLDDFGDEPGLEQLLVRRASMPVVTARYQQSKLHQELSSTHRQEMDEEKKKDTPYSRSPELRISHKLAERKRRKEMKDLFDELRDSLPVEKNMKTSKWEILSKAVEYISLLKRKDYEMEMEITGLRREIDMIKRKQVQSPLQKYNINL